MNMKTVNFSFLLNLNFSFLWQCSMKCGRNIYLNMYRGQPLNNPQRVLDYV